MARTIKDIQNIIIANVMVYIPALRKSSATAQWKIWAYITAIAIHSFELILDIFKTDMEELTKRITPGTLRWYAEMCRRFQMGHELAYDPQTAMLYYAVDDPASRIIKIVAVSESNSVLAVKAAKIDDQGKISALSVDELHNFKGYIDAIKFVGIDTSVISTTPDSVRYEMEVFYDPIYPKTTIESRVREALETYKSNLNFDSKLYAARLSDSIMHIEGVVTVSLASLERRGAAESQFSPVGVFCELYAGYFDWDKDCILTLTSMK